MDIMHKCESKICKGRALNCKSGAMSLCSATPSPACLAHVLQLIMQGLTSICWLAHTVCHAPPPSPPPSSPPPPVLRARCLQPNGSDSKGWYVESRSDIFPYDLWTSMARARGRPLPTPAPKRYSGPGYGCYANGTKCCRQATPGCPTCPSDAWDPSILYGCTVSAGWQFHLAVCSTWTRDVGCVAAAACPNFKSMLPVRLCA